MIRGLMKTIQPYFELARLDRPVGIPIIVFPYLYGFFFAILTAKPNSPNERHLLFAQLPLLILSGTILRCLGCAWNDIVDVDVDRHVQRTRSRPLARGAISFNQALSFTAFLLATWVLSLQPLFSSNYQLELYTIPLVLFVLIYPFAKRVSSYAQVWLGLTLAWGVLAGAAIAGQDILNDFITTLRVSSSYSLEPRNQGPVALFMANIVWTIVYDTIYAFQDASDDKKIGMNSMALQLDRWAKPLLGLLVSIHTWLLMYAGRMIVRVNGDYHDDTPYSHATALGQMLYVATKKLGFGSTCLDGKALLLPYQVFVVSYSAVGLGLALILVNLQSPRSCGFWFKHTSVSLGSSVLLGFVLQYMWWR